MQSGYTPTQATGAILLEALKLAYSNRFPVEIEHWAKTPVEMRALKRAIAKTHNRLAHVYKIDTLPLVEDVE